MHKVVQRRALAAAALVALLLSLLVASIPGVASADDNRTPSTFIAVMLGRNEIPGPGDADGFGLAFVHFDGTQTCFTLQWRNIAAPNRGHIHQGAAGIAGPIVLPFFEGEIPSPINSAHGCVTADAALIDSIRGNPAGFYVNLHNAEFPAGAIRGQLRPFPFVPRDHSRLEATLLGANEVPGPGDPDGSGRAGVDAFGSRICWTASWSGIATPTRGHIHQGPAGVAGPIVVPFFEAPAGLPTTLDSVSGCTVDVDRDLVRAIRTGPSGFYVNLHNVDFPGGAIRGQLHR
jgi:CHRD domain